MKRTPDQIIKGVCVSEKSTVLTSNLNKYVFEVFSNANRTEVAKAIEELFKINVQKVNIIRRAGKRKRNRMKGNPVVRTDSLKRAIVTIGDGQKIEIV